MAVPALLRAVMMLTRAFGGRGSAICLMDNVGEGAVVEPSVLGVGHERNGTA